MLWEALFQASPTELPTPPPPMASCPRCVGCVTAVAMSATLGECGSKNRCPAPFPSLSVVASASSPLAGTAVYRLVIGVVVR